MKRIDLYHGAFLRKRVSVMLFIPMIFIPTAVQSSEQDDKKQESGLLSVLKAHMPPPLSTLVSYYAGTYPFIAYRIQDHKEGQQRLLFNRMSCDAQFIVTAAQSQDQKSSELRVYRAATGEQVEHIDLAGAKPHDAQWSADARYLVYSYGMRYCIHRCKYSDYKEKKATSKSSYADDRYHMMLRVADESGFLPFHIEFQDNIIDHTTKIKRKTVPNYIVRPDRVSFYEKNPDYWVRYYSSLSIIELVRATKEQSVVRRTESIIAIDDAYRLVIAVDNRPSPIIVEPRWGPPFVGSSYWWGLVQKFNGSRITLLSGSQSYVAAATANGLFGVYRRDSPSPLFVTQSPVKPLKRISLSPHNLELLAYASEKEVLIADASTGNQLNHLRCSSPIVAFDWHADGFSLGLKSGSLYKFGM